MTTKEEADAVSGEADKFPIGLGVLVVDNDLRCLNLVETMLKECKYNVTTASGPLEALKMLREDKNRFDIVLTEAIMPGMDDFFLPQWIKLETDIPFIILSAHSETKYVLRGVQLGACNYLVKPCRVLELQNIWMHVSKRKLTSKNSTKRDDVQGLALPETPESSDKAGQKRKHYNRGEEANNGGSGAEDAVARTRKKKRYVWSPERHQKFVEAVHRLTLEKAVPRKIVELMDDKELTTGHVASHLQKYRLSQKRDEAARNEQRNLMNARSLEGLQLLESRRLPNIPILSTPPSAVLSSFISYPCGYNEDGIASTGSMQRNASQNMNSCFGLLGNFQQSQYPELYHGNPRSLEVNPFDTLSGFSYPARFSSNGVALASSINSGPRWLVNGSHLQGNQNVLGAAPRMSESFNIGPHATSNHWVGEQSRTSRAHSLMGLPSMNAVQNAESNLPVEVFPCQEDPIAGVEQVNGAEKAKGEEEHRSFTGHDPNHWAMNMMNPPPLSSSEHLSFQSEDDMASSGQHNAAGGTQQAEPSMEMEDVLALIDFDSLDGTLNMDHIFQELEDQKKPPMDGVLLPRC